MTNKTKPQLSGEMNALFDRKFHPSISEMGVKENNVPIECVEPLKQFLATALEEQKAKIATLVKNALTKPIERKSGYRPKELNYDELYKLLDFLN